jgi:UPF0755 protein
MKKIVILFVIIIMTATGVGLKIYSDAKNIIEQPFTAQDEKIEVNVKNGDTLNSIINSLYDENKIGNSYLIKWYIKKNKLNTNIKPGDYSFTKDTSLESFINTLGKGKYNENAIKVTIPEGFDIEKMAQLFQDKQIISKEEFIASVKAYNLPSYVKNDSKRKYALEGYLFPDTYEFIKGMKGNDIINILLKNFETVLEDIKIKNNIVLPQEQIDEKIIMASIVERESELASERPTIASVFYNRIKDRMMLQSCATVEYVLGVHKVVYTEKDISIDSPFNTYKVNGLPAGPICSPGRSSILAALQPAKTDYIYFVSKFNGTKEHFFSKDYSEFLKNKKTSEANYAKMNK